ncbi:MAG: glycosyltransferase family 4 protein [Bacteroidaceae bacterium]|nr:glycosyltransferase family 4 protein [Bacteroidaceae bacterium]
MKIAYISRLGFADCDFPLIREMQNKSVDVTYYIQCNCWGLKGTLFNIKKQYHKAGIFPSTIYADLLEPYKKFLDLTKVKIINRTNASAYHPSTILLQLKLLRELIKEEYDVIHITYPLEKTECLLYYLHSKMVLTMHDPIPHSNNMGNRHMQQMRKLAYHLVPKMVLLNKTMLEEFCNVNNIQRTRVFVTKLGSYDCISMLEPIKILSVTVSSYILFFGGISPYKGVEYLVLAFNKISEKFPDVRLVIAGGGRVYFDKDIYEKNNNIIFINRYIDIRELASLLKGCLFTVCPYKDATQSGVLQTSFTMEVPAIVTNVGALPNPIVKYETGLVVEPCDVDALADSISYMLNNPQEVKRMKDNINSKWKPQMAWANIVDEYLKCYTAII